MDPQGNFQSTRKVFAEESSKHGLKGVLGVAAFGTVFGALLPVQRRRLEELCGGDLHDLMRCGSVISIAYAYPEHAIDAIALRSGDGYDKEAWNIYAREYRRLNWALDATAERLAEGAEGVFIPATSVGVAEKVEHVEDFYGMVVSHRVAAEQSGIGWRGRN